MLWKLFRNDTSFYQYRMSNITQSTGASTTVSSVPTLMVSGPQTSVCGQPYFAAFYLPKLRAFATKHGNGRIVVGNAKQIDEHTQNWAAMSLPASQVTVYVPRDDLLASQFRHERGFEIDATAESYPKRDALMLKSSTEPPLIVLPWCGGGVSGSVVPLLLHHFPSMSLDEAKAILKVLRGATQPESDPRNKLLMTLVGLVYDFVYETDGDDRAKAATYLVNEVRGAI